jgi:hypothetical protein
VPGNVAGKLQVGGLAEGPGQLGGFARLDQHAVGVVVLHAWPMLPSHGHGAMVHLVHAGRRHHAALLHLQHFLLVLGMHRRVTEVELVQQLTFIDQDKANRLTGLDLDGLGVERHVPITTSTVRVALAPVPVGRSHRCGWRGPDR